MSLGLIKDGEKKKILGGGGSGGGHVIQNQSGTDMTQRDTMQFVDAKVSDDSTNGKTKISVLQEGMTVEDFEDAVSLPDGIYPIEEDDLVNISGDMIEYDNTDSGLTATNAQDAIDELNADITDMPRIVRNGYTTVTISANGEITKGITFDSPLASVNNMTIITTVYGADCIVTGISQITVNGFTLLAYNLSSVVQSDITIKYVVIQ